tara:strand:+ start:269 stop:448 length:180 start_codon:yes stop_codon:yes gene_type:complete
MSCLQNEALLEQCWEEAFESFRVSNKLTEAELNELLSFSKGTADAIEQSARIMFESMCH